MYKIIAPIFIIIIFLIYLIKFLKKDEKLEKESMKNIKSNNNKKKVIRYMYNSSGIKKNSLYDSRGEVSFIKYEPEKTGKLFYGDLENNLTNDRIKK